MDFTTLQIGIEKNVARIALNRPEVRNAMNALMIKELTEAVDWLDARDDIRVIEICGNGKSFCAGADINYMKDVASFGYDQNLEDAKRLSKLFQKIYFCNKPVITLVHGAVIGGGNGITAASDIVLAEKDTVFAFSEVKLGLTPATISPFVIARCGEMPARDLMLSGRKFTAQEAREYKLVNFVGDIDEINKKLDAYIDDFLKASPDAIRDCKHLIRNVGGISTPYSSVFDMTAQLIAQERMSDDAQERMRGFLEL
ncbi:MAG: enoyl-CoA hydratase/isomerase family protein [Lentimicrobiaceae bacterium]|nr:enoyl-CoA hydratase/isomerase family protein [Lentimicrobiaceae bacterium]